MRDHELELIYGLASGELEDPSEALLLVNSSDEMRRKYEAQLQALQELRSVKPALMTDSERAALHRDLWSELRSQPERKANPWYYRWIPVGAAAALLLGVGSVLISTSGGEDTAETFTEIASSLDGGAMGESATVNADHAVETTSAAAGESSDDFARDSLPDEATLKSAIAQYRLAADEEGAGTPQSTREDLESCLHTLGLDGYVVIDALEDTDESVRAQLFTAAPADANRAISPISVIVLDVCEILLVDEPSG